MGCRRFIPKEKASTTQVAYRTGRPSPRHQAHPIDEKTRKRQKETASVDEVQCRAGNLGGVQDAAGWQMAYDDARTRAAEFVTCLRSEWHAIGLADQGCGGTAAVGRLTVGEIMAAGRNQ